MRWRFWRKTPPAVDAIDLGELLSIDQPDVISQYDHLLAMPVSDRAQAKATKRAAQGKPAHRMRQSLPHKGSPIVSSYPDWLNEDPPWMRHG